jgi:hypothetical protein
MHASRGWTKRLRDSCRAIGHSCLQDFMHSGEFHACLAPGAALACLTSADAECPASPRAARGKILSVLIVQACMQACMPSYTPARLQACTLSCMCAGLLLFMHDIQRAPGNSFPRSSPGAGPVLRGGHAGARRGQSGQFVHCRVLSCVKPCPDRGLSVCRGSGFASASLLAFMHDFMGDPFPASRKTAAHMLRFVPAVIPECIHA